MVGLSKSWQQTFSSTLENSLQIQGIFLSAEQRQACLDHARELLFWNQKTNLTTITDPQEVAEKHFSDSMRGAVFCRKKDYVLDIGSGGGFPGIPLKIACPDIRLLMVDSSRKKINFLKQTIRTLGFEGVDAVHARIEDLATDTRYQEKFDMAISRAFAELKAFITAASPLIKSSGMILSMKSASAAAEITTDIEKNWLIETTRYCLPSTSAQRCIFKITRR